MQCNISLDAVELAYKKMNEEIEEIPKPVLIKDLGTMYPTESSKERRRYGLYKCGFCGTNFKASTSNISTGNTKSCGCYKKRRISETHKTHGLGYTKLYRVWTDIKNRTLNPKHNYYFDYGGRGINICEEWLDLHNFYNWAISNGYSEDLTIDRIDNDEGYFPENCRWTTKTIQSRNQRVYKNNTSGYKGVSCDKGGYKYKAQIKVNNKNIYLGSFPTAVEGAVAYNNYIIENNLEGFILNEILG
jgi:hypothetical protein